MRRQLQQKEASRPRMPCPFSVNHHHIQRACKRTIRELVTVRKRRARKQRHASAHLILRRREGRHDRLLAVGGAVVLLVLLVEVTQAAAPRLQDATDDRLRIRLRLLPKPDDEEAPKAVPKDAGGDRGKRGTERFVDLRKGAAKAAVVDEDALHRVDFEEPGLPGSLLEGVHVHAHGCDGAPAGARRGWRREQEGYGDELASGLS